METPEISVVVTCCNRANYLRETLESLQRQTLENFEVIIVDDHSEEDLRSVVEEFQDPRFKYFQNDGRRGPSAARNFGNRQASAELIAVADSDDILLPRRLAVAVEHFKNNPDTDIFYGNIYTFEDGTYNFKFYRHFGAYDRDWLYDKDFVPHVTVVYRKADILAHPYNEDLNSAIDYDMLLTFADRERVFRFSTEPFVLYRRHPDQISRDPERLKAQTENAVKVRAAHAEFRNNPIHE